MRKLLIHADDFGLTPAVSRGIVRAIDEGAVTGTAAMLCAEGAAATIARLAPKIPGRIGLHLQLTDGTPAADPATLPSLIAFGGRFPRRRQQLLRLDADDVRREWRAQLAALRELGVEPAYLDSHHHVHKERGAFEVYCELAAELGVPARAGGARLVAALRRRGAICADAFTDVWFGRELTVDGLVRCAVAAAERTPDATTVEVMCHPGEVDDELERRSSYVEERARELAVLRDPELRVRLADAGFELARADHLTSGEAGLR